MNEPPPISRYRNLGEMLRTDAAAFPERVALIFEDRRRNYGELDAASDQAANALLAAGYGGQTHIGILGRNSDIYIELLFGITKAGCAAILLNWRLIARELQAIAEDSEIRALFYDTEFAPVVAALRSSLHSDVRYIAFDGGSGTAVSEYDHFRSGGSSEPPRVDVAPTDNAILMYTSGTTGMPKGVPSTHFAHLWAIGASLAGPAGSKPGDVNLLTTPLFHLAAIGWSLGSLCSGATLVILPKVEMSAVVAAIDKHRVSRAVVLPVLMPALLDATADGMDLSSLRVICYGASAIPETLLARMIDAFQCGFLQNYGMTEISGSATSLKPADHFPGSPWLLSCGQACPEVEIKIVAEDGSACPVGETGEILLRTKSLMKGYWRAPAATEEVMRDGWYASGDMGYLDRDGYLFLRDRKKDMIVSGGENVYSAEVESALAAHPAVARAAVIGVPSDRWGEEVKAVVVLRADADLSAAALTEFLRSRLASYKLPKSVEYVPELPLTPVGKVAKHILRERYWAGRGRYVN